MTDKTIPKKSLGQHWLRDAKTLHAIINTAGVTDQDTILEIGPGTGTLTRFLVKKAKLVVAVEFDRHLADKLQRQLDAKNLQIIEADIRRFDLTKLPKDYKIVANIPYYLTAYLLRILTEVANKPKTAVLLVQKEVAERVTAGPGNMSLISLAAQFYYSVSLGQIVPAKLFSPPPKVDSQVLVLNRLRKSMFNDLDHDKFLRLIKIGFTQPRKTLINNLRPIIRDEHLNKILLKYNLSTKVRAQELSIQNWHDLYSQIENKL